jgi:hypothetical protein
MKLVLLNKKINLKSSTFAGHTSQHTTKTCKRACLANTRTDRKYAAKMKDRITKDKNGQLVTGGMFYCRDSAEVNDCGSLQTSSWLDRTVLRSRQQKHTAVRYQQA